MHTIGVRSSSSRSRSCGIMIVVVVWYRVPPSANFDLRSMDELICRKFKPSWIHYYNVRFTTCFSYQYITIIGIRIGSLDSSAARSSPPGFTTTMCAFYLMIVHSLVYTSSSSSSSSR